MEIDLIREFIPAEDTARGPECLFQKHFSVYHALHVLKGKAGRRGYYLHLDPQRIRLLPVPGQGSCGYYYPEEGCFCGAVEKASGRCENHLRADSSGVNLPVHDPLHEFYMNRSNISFGESTELAANTEAIKNYALNREAADTALAVLGISRPDPRKIKERYRAVAREAHPDLNGGDDTRMKEINEAFSLLESVFRL